MLREGAPGPSWTPVFAALVCNEVVEDRVAGTPSAGAVAAAAVQSVVQAAAVQVGVPREVEADDDGVVGIEIVRDDNKDAAFMGIEIVRQSDEAAQEGILGIEIVRDGERHEAAPGDEEENGILGIEIVRDTDDKPHDDDDDGIWGIEIVREGSENLPLLEDLPEVRATMMHQQQCSCIEFLPHRVW